MQTLTRFTVTSLLFGKGLEELLLEKQELN